MKTYDKLTPDFTAQDMPRFEKRDCSHLLQSALQALAAVRHDVRHSSALNVEISRIIIPARRQTDV